MFGSSPGILKILLKNGAFQFRAPCDVKVRTDLWTAGFTRGAVAQLLPRLLALECVKRRLLLRSLFVLLQVL